MKLSPSMFVMLVSLAMPCACSKSSGSVKKKDEGSTSSKRDEKADLEKGYGGLLDKADLMTSSGPHSPEEPSTFSAGWVGAEAGMVLRRAIDRDLSMATVSANGHQCLIFHEDKMIRRLVLRYDGTSYEYAMSAAGHIILWYSAEAYELRRQNLAYFHHGNTLALNQVWEGDGPRRTEPPLEGLQDFIFREARGCFRSFGARNPDPGAALAPAASPAVTPPSPVAPSPAAPPPVPPPPAGDLPTDGQLVQIVAKHSGKCLVALEAGGGRGQKIVQDTCSQAKNQQFRFWVRGAGFAITSEATGLCVDVDGASRDDQASLVQSTCTSMPNQIVVLQGMGPGEMRFDLQHSGKCVDVRGASADSLADLIQFECHDKDNQRFLLRTVR